MHTLEGLRRTIDTATDLQSVVKTMKTLAAVRIRQYEKAVEALADYNRTIQLGFQILLHQHHPAELQVQRSTGATGLIVFGTDQGMCGQFNEQIVSFVGEKANRQDASWKLAVVGARTEGLTREAGWAPERTFPVPTSAGEITELIQDLLLHVQHWQAELGLKSLIVFYNERTSHSSYEPRKQQILPIAPEQFRTWSQAKWESRCLPMFTMDRKELLSCVIREYLFVSLFRACAESLASENASRIAAMESAGKNIDERLEELNDAFNQLRQQSITEELLDVVSGFEAMSREREKHRRAHRKP